MPSTPSVSDPRLLGQVIDLIRGVFRGHYHPGNAKESLLGLLTTMTEANMIDWQANAWEDSNTPDHSLYNPDGQTVSTFLACRRWLQRPLLDMLIDRYGKAILCIGDRQGTPAYQSLWTALFLDKGSKTYRSDEESMSDWIERLPAKELTWLDVDGDTAGAGWLAAALKGGHAKVVSALMARGLSMNGQHRGTPLCLSIKAPSQWDSYISVGGDPDKIVAGRPIWWHLSRGNLRSPPELVAHIDSWMSTRPSDDGTETSQAHETIAYWNELEGRYRRPGTRGTASAVREALTSVDDWRERRDEWGRPAAWVAALSEPPLIRESLKVRTAKVLTERDEKGRGAWFYLFHLLGAKTCTDKVWRELVSACAPSLYAQASNGDGLVVQWAKSKMDGSGLRICHRHGLFASKPDMYDSESNRLMLDRLEAFSFEDLWGGTDHDVERVGRWMATHPNTGVMRLIAWMACMSARNSKQPTVDERGLCAVRRLSPITRGCLFIPALLYHDLISSQALAAIRPYRAAVASNFLERLEAAGCQLPDDALDLMEQHWRAVDIQQEASRGSQSRIKAKEEFRDVWRERLGAYQTAQRLERRLMEEHTQKSPPVRRAPRL